MFNYFYVWFFLLFNFFFLQLKEQNDAMRLFQHNNRDNVEPQVCSLMNNLKRNVTVLKRPVTNSQTTRRHISPARLQHSKAMSWTQWLWKLDLSSNQNKTCQRRGHTCLTVFRVQTTTWSWRGGRAILWGCVYNLEPAGLTSGERTWLIPGIF